MLLGDQVASGKTSIGLALDSGLDSVTAVSTGTNVRQNVSVAGMLKIMFVQSERDEIERKKPGAEIHKIHSKILSIAVFECLH